MASTEAFRRGACPGVGSPMESGDGLISRVRLPTSRLTADQLARLATLSEQHGQGLLELTSRGNLQIRGLTETSERHLSHELVATGFAAADPELEASRNIQCSPAADMDPTSIADPTPLAARLDERIRDNPEFRELPPKFRFVLNGGGHSHLAQVDGDIRADAVTTANGIGYRIALGGTAQTARGLGVCDSDGVVDALARIAHCFLSLNRKLVTPVRRLSGSLTVHGAHPFLEALGNRLRTEAPELPMAPEPPRPGPLEHGFVAGVPLGRLGAGLARTLSGICTDDAKAEVRITPWRQVIIPGPPERLGPRLKDAGLITDPRDPRNSIVTCPGSPECRSGTTRTQEDALHWAEAVPALFNGNTTVHISGCGKGCARPRQSPVTLTAREGLYDLILNDQALPEDEHNRVVRGLKPAEVPDALHALISTAQLDGSSDESTTQAIQRVGQASRNSR